jgi:hypothetical protein
MWAILTGEFFWWSISAGGTDLVRELGTIK